MLNLGNAYWSRLRGDRMENLELAIGCYSAALKEFSPKTAPVEWAITNNDLGNAYADRIRGTKSANLWQATHYYEAALEVSTPTRFPVYCRDAAKNLGDVYAELEQWDDAVRAYYTARAAAEVLYKASVFRGGKEAELTEPPTCTCAPPTLGLVLAIPMRLSLPLNVVWRAGLVS